MVDLSRRNFLKVKKVTSQPAVRLPWAHNEANFTQGCNQCGDCLLACPEKIIIKGDGGFPEIDFSQGECSFCQKCVQACSEPLFTSFDTPPWQLEINIKNNCLAKKQVHCQVCQDSCEPEAISFRYIQASVPQPEISYVDCTGCGACVSICPESAITLTPPEIGDHHE